MKRILLTSFLGFTFLLVNAQLKSYYNYSGNVAIGATGPTGPTNKLGVTGNIDVLGSGNGYCIQGNKSLWYNGTATSNIFVGVGAGSSITTGTKNTLTGFQSGKSLTSGNENTISGDSAFYFNSSGSFNTITGYRAGRGVSGNNYNYNSFYGYRSGEAMTTGTSNVFFGPHTGLNNTNSYSTFMGYNSGVSSTSSGNCFFGHQSGYNSTTGGGNAFFGTNTGYYNSSGYNNTAIGYTAMADNQITTGSYNTFLGFNTDANGNYSNSAAIGSNATATGNDRMYLGDANAKIYCALGVWTGSDGRFKFNVQENVLGLDFIKKLRPVTYQMNTENLDAHMRAGMTGSDSIGNIENNRDFSVATGIIHSGFIAQEVETAAQESGFTTSIIQAPENDKDHYAINYAQLVVPIIKGMQELITVIDSLKAKPSERKAIDKVDSLVQVIENLKSLVNQCCRSTINQQTGNNQENKNKEGSIPVELISSDNVILYQNIPNPFTDETTINYYLPETVKSAKMLFYDDAGRIIKEMKLELKGNNSIVVNSAKLANGFYSYSLEVDGKVTETKKMLRSK